METEPKLTRFAVLVKVELLETHLIEVYATTPSEAQELAGSLRSLEEIDDASILTGRDEDVLVIPIQVSEILDFDESGDSIFYDPEYLENLSTYEAD